jgi:hypothetical protein
MNELAQFARTHNAVVANLNLAYQRNAETNRTSVTLNGLLVAIIERSPGEVFTVQMVNIATTKSHLVGSQAVFDFLNSECSKWLFSCWK